VATGLADVALGLASFATASTSDEARSLSTMAAAAPEGNEAHSAGRY